jgi:hypothetical protein
MPDPQVTLQSQTIWGKSGGLNYYKIPTWDPQDMTTLHEGSEAIQGSNDSTGQEIIDVMVPGTRVIQSQVLG